MQNVHVVSRLDHVLSNGALIIFIFIRYIYLYFIFIFIPYGRNIETGLISR
jgi:hypothetical protein